MELRDKVVLVTGAARRLGAEIARALAARGAQVAIHYHSSRSEAETLAAEINGRTFRADLAVHEDVLALPARVVAEMGRLDALVNSAAVFRRGPFGGVTLEDWDLHMDLNLRAPFFLTQGLLRLLPSEREARVVNLSDARGDVMDGRYPAYSLSKAGLQSMTRGLSVALAPRVRVYALALGHMLPVAGDPEEKPPPDDALLPGFAPDGTTGEAVAFLLGPGDFATGSVLYLDGGRHLKEPGGRGLPLGERFGPGGGDRA